MLGATYVGTPVRPKTRTRVPAGESALERICINTFVHPLTYRKARRPALSGSYLVERGRSRGGVEDDLEARRRCRRARRTRWHSRSHSRRARDTARSR